jgi:D-beta-D-heptose 7-phosphate kinase/D-beta-D-heptose 1-phosphate adenosyltransferase
MNTILGDMKPDIILLGDIMLDHNLKGQCNKIANEGPIPVINIQNEVYGIGGCGNVLLNMCALGAKKIHLFSRIGNDTNGTKISSLLPSNIINNMIVDNTFTTITKTRIYSDNKIVARYDKENIFSITYSQEEEIVKKIKETLDNNKISSVVFSDYNKGFLTRSLCQNIISLCKNIINDETLSV